jgi:hypothetical protein
MRSFAAPGATATMSVVCAIIQALSTARGNIVASLRKLSSATGSTFNGALGTS